MLTRKCPKCGRIASIRVERTFSSRCLKVGFVRFENVIRGGLAQCHCYCGACNHSWAIADDSDATPRALASDRQSKAHSKARQSAAHAR